MNNQNKENLYNNLINKYKRTGKIGRTKPFNLDHAQRIAWTITQKITNTNNKYNKVDQRSIDGALTVGQPCCQLKLF